MHLSVFTLPQAIDAVKVTADYEDGVLQIEIAKKSEAQPRQVKVGAGTDAKQVEGKAGA